MTIQTTQQPSHSPPPSKLARRSLSLPVTTAHHGQITKAKTEAGSWDASDAEAADGSLQRRYLPLQKIRAPICAQTIKSAGKSTRCRSRKCTVGVLLCYLIELMS